jgi:hypothetical protein
VLGFNLLVSLGSLRMESTQYPPRLSCQHCDAATDEMDEYKLFHVNFLAQPHQIVVYILPPLPSNCRASRHRRACSKTATRGRFLMLPIP